MVAREAKLFGAQRRLYPRFNDRLMHHRARIQRLGKRRIAVHHRRQQGLVERTPIDADADGPVEAQGRLDHQREIAVLLLLEADIAGIDPIFRQCLGASRMIGKQCVAIIVEVADERRRDAHLVEPVANMGNRSCRLVAVDGDAHKFRTRLRQGRRLPRCRLDIGRIGVGHRLDDDRRTTAHDDLTDLDGHRMAALACGRECGGLVHRP